MYRYIYINRLFFKKILNQFNYKEEEDNDNNSGSDDSSDDEDKPKEKLLPPLPKFTPRKRNNLIQTCHGYQRYQCQMN